MGEFSPWHLLILAAVFVLLFGAKKLPDAARSMGRSLRIFRTEIKGMNDDDDGAAKTAAQPSEPAQLTAPPRAVPVSPADQPASTVSDSTDGR